MSIRSLDRIPDSVRATALALCAALPLALPAQPVAAAGPAAASSSSGQTTSDAPDDSKRDEWVKRYEDLRAKNAALKKDLDQATADYTRGRTSNYLKGPGREGLVAEMKRLEEELAKSDEELKAFPDEARRAGALPGWFRDVDDAPPAEAALPDLESRRPVRGRSETMNGRIGHSEANEDRASGEGTPDQNENDQSAQEDEVGSENLRSLKRDGAKSRRLPW